MSTSGALVPEAMDWVRDHNWDSPSAGGGLEMTVGAQTSGALVPGEALWASLSSPTRQGGRHHASGAAADALESEQGLLHVEASAEAAQRAAGRDDPVTWDHEGNRVAAHGASGRSSGPGPARLRRHPPVRPDLTMRDASRGAERTPGEARETGQIDRMAGKVHNLPVEVAAKIVCQLLQPPVRAPKVSLLTTRLQSCLSCGTRQGGPDQQPTAADRTHPTH